MVSFAGHELETLYPHYFDRFESPPPMYCTNKEKNDLIESIKDNFTVACPAGELFTCHIIDGEELWYSDNGEISEYDSYWAEKYLKDIKKVNKNGSNE